MTKEEFLKQRAIDEYLKTKGVTPCPPGNAWAEPAFNVGQRHRKAHINSSRVAATIVKHPTDETGEPVPILRRPIL